MKGIITQNFELDICIVVKDVVMELKKFHEGR